MLDMLTAENGFIFRITHIGNLPWLLTHGLHCANGTMTDPNFVAIGNPDLIGKRNRQAVRIAPCGTIADYIPFYFTPRSPMLYNIRTGRNGVTMRPNEQIVVLVSSASAMAEHGVTMVFTDRHASAATADWCETYNHAASLIDWDILRRHDFARDHAYPDKMERYQAEALGHRHVPPNALLGLGCCSEAVAAAVSMHTKAAQPKLRIVTRQNWFFA